MYEYLCCMINPYCEFCVNLFLSASYATLKVDLSDYKNLPAVVFKPGAHRPVAGARLVSYNCFCVDVCMCVCLCVCPPPRLLITSSMMWCDIDSRRLVKQVL